MSCAEYRSLSRRRFLQVGGKASAAALAAPGFADLLPRLVLAESFVGGRDILISIFLRGGADGLSLCAPWADPHYRSARPTLAVAPPDGTAIAARGIALDDRFAFPPAMAALMPAYRAQDLLVVHAAGQSSDSRSHFDAQRFMEVGKAADPAVATGWLARHLMSAPPARGNTPLRGVALMPGLPRTLTGAPATLPIDDLAEIGMGGAAATLESRIAFMRSVYGNEPDPLGRLGLDGLLASQALSAIDVRRYTPAGGIVYPATPFASSLRSIAAVIKFDVGLEAAHLDLPGWDTHAQQDPHGGTMFSLMTTLAEGLAAFHADVIARDLPVTLVAVSEFGRHLGENASGGTDHGRGTVMFVMGRHVAGGRVLVNQWPGLAPEQLEDQALRVTIDYRDVLAEIIDRRLGNGNVGAVFPGFTPTVRGVIRGSSATAAGAGRK